MELYRCAQADFSPSVSQGAPKIDFGEARFRCVAFLPMNRGEIMCRVMCACVVHAPQVISRLQESKEGNKAQETHGRAYASEKWRTAGD